VFFKLVQEKEKLNFVKLTKEIFSIKANHDKKKIKNKSFSFTHLGHIITNIWWNKGLIVNFVGQYKGGNE